MLPAWVGLDLEDFNTEAQKSVRWMMDHLSEENKAYLDGLPEKYHVQCIHNGAWQPAISDLGIHPYHRRCTQQLSCIQYEILPGRSQPCTGYFPATEE